MEREIDPSPFEEISIRWQIPVDRVIYFHEECGMPLVDDDARGIWFAENYESLVKPAMEKAFEEKLFGPELSETTA